MTVCTSSLCNNGTVCCCEDPCPCTETLCQCAASSIMNSLPSGTGETTTNITTTTTTKLPEQWHLQAHWNIQMHCGACVRTVQGILGNQAHVDLETNSANRSVQTRAQANQLTLDLQEVGLESTLISIEEIQEQQLLLLLLQNLDQKPTTIQPSMHHSQAFGEDPLLEPATHTYQPPSQQTQTVELLVGGMTCAMCSRAITQALQESPGVINVTVSLATNVATIDFNHTIATLEELKHTIQSLGYKVTQLLSNQPETKLEQLTKQQHKEVKHKKNAFIWSLIGTLPIVTITMMLPHVLSMTSPIMAWLHTTVLVLNQQIMRESLLLWGLATMVQFGSGFTFYRTSYHNIQSGKLGMDILVAIGTTASYIYACYEMWRGQEAHFFETSSVLIAFVLLGKWMNSLAVRRTSDALTQLMKLQAKSAIQIKPKDTTKTMWNPQTPSTGTNTFNPMMDAYDEETVSVDLIHPRDTVKVLRGASIPADGVVSHGEMTVDESMITGESVPVLKTPGSFVLGGTVCIETSGAFVFVNGVGASTALAQIVQLVQEAQTRQVPIQSLADTISGIFVPVVCICSVVTYMTWYALCMTGVVPSQWFDEEGPCTFSLMFGIACLVISCPCALGLATPTAVMVGTGVGAKHGILMKGGEALEAASKVDAVVFDKTGTLTKGKPCITDFWQVDHSQYNKEYILWLLGSLERNSEHPLANAVVSFSEIEIAAYLENQPFCQPNDFQASTGRGASGRIDGVTVAVGNRSFCAIKNVTISSQVEVKMTELEQEGKTAITASIGGEIVCVMGIADELKADAAASIAYLQKKMGMDVWMVTGDNSRTARAISMQLGLSPDKVIAEALPVAKVQQVKTLQAQGKKVAMIGDGINDSPALAQADVGMSLGTGAEIAAEAADMVLVRGHVQDVCIALDLSRVIFHRIQLNLFFSLVYNCLGIPVAAGLLYPFIHTRLPPTLAAVAMALSSFSVVSSSLALRLYTPPRVEVTQQQSFIQQVIQQIGSKSAVPQVSADNDLTQPLLGNGCIVDPFSGTDRAALTLEEGT